MGIRATLTIQGALQGSVDVPTDGEMGSSQGEAAQCAGAAAAPAAEGAADAMHLPASGRGSRGGTAPW